MKINEIISEGSPTVFDRGDRLEYKMKFTIPIDFGNGKINLRYTVMKLNGEIPSFSFAYINLNYCSVDNGRVLGYDNSHGFAHKHYYGNIIPLPTSVQYSSIYSMFKSELGEILVDEFIKRNNVLKEDEKNNLRDSMMSLPEVKSFFDTLKDVLARADDYKKRIQESEIDNSKESE